MVSFSIARLIERYDFLHLKRFFGREHEETAEQSPQESAD